MLNLIENSAAIEMGLLGFLPTAEHFINREKIHLREHAGVLFGDRFQPWAEKMPGREFLPFGSIEIFQVFLSDVAGPVPCHDAVNPGHGRFSKDAK